MLCQDARSPAKAAGLFQMRRIPKTLPYSQPSPRTIPLGNCTHILAFKVEEGSLVERGHIFN